MSQSSSIHLSSERIGVVLYSPLLRSGLIKFGNFLITLQDDELASQTDANTSPTVVQTIFTEDSFGQS